MARGPPHLPQTAARQTRQLAEGPQVGLSMYFYLAVTSLVVSAGIRFPGVPYYYRAQTAQYTYRISIPADWHSDVDA